MQRYSQFTEILHTDEGKRRYSTLYYPKFEKKTSDIYIVCNAADRLDLISFNYYGDARYWVVLARANKLNNATLKPPIGFKLRIPYPLNTGDVDQIFRDTQF
jgi:hypothetical protein